MGVYLDWNNSQALGLAAFGKFRSLLCSWTQQTSSELCTPLVCSDLRHHCGHCGDVLITRRLVKARSIFSVQLEWRSGVCSGIGIGNRREKWSA